MKTVGVVIPIYNVAEYLKECLDSVSNQSYKNIEVVLINDGSTDENSLNIAKEYTLKDKRFILIDKENSGQSTARNVGIEYFAGELDFKCVQREEKDFIAFEIQGQNSRHIRRIYKSVTFFHNEEEKFQFKNPSIDFIMFLDPDDYWSLDCIEECIKRSENMDIVWFDYKMFYEISKKFYKNNVNLEKSLMQIYEYYKPEKITSMQWLERSLKVRPVLPFWCVWGGMYSFAYLLKIKLKFLDGLIHEDVHFGILLFIQAEYIYVFPKILYYYRIRLNSTSSYGKKITQASLPPYIRNLYAVFKTDAQVIKHYHASSSIFLNAWNIREFIKNDCDEKKGVLLERAFYLYLYFSYFYSEIANFKEDPRGIKVLFKEHQPVYEQNRKRYPELDFFCKYGFVSEKIKNYFSYKLGQILIDTKIYNFYLIPFKIIFEFIRFKFKKKVKFPRLEEYPDYKDADRIKGYLSYQFGQALIKSMKKWYLAQPLFLPFIWYKIYRKKKLERNNSQNYSSWTERTSQFIFPEHTLINISENKQATQSSLSFDARFNNASRALNSKIHIDNYAFCTSKERLSWWAVDLEEISFIEMIKLVNTENEYLRMDINEIAVYVSNNNIQWTLIPNEFFIVKHSNFECNVLIRNKIMARYIKIQLKKFRRDSLRLGRVEVFKRRKKGYIISSKPDGFGMRLASMLVGMYLAKKMNFEFGFLWDNSIDLAFMGITQSHKDENINYLGNCMDEVDRVFDQSFIDEYFLPQEGLQYSHGNIIRKQKRTFDKLCDEENFEHEWGYYSTDVLPSKWIRDCDEKECLQEIKKCYQEIKFSYEFQQVLTAVEDKIGDLKNNFIALHLRGGDIIFSDIRKTPNFQPVRDRLFPYEIALEIAIQELNKNKNIVIFGQDLNANEELANHLKSLSQFKHLNIINIDSLVNPNYTEMQRTFFEINFMSKAEKIYSARESVFSKLAMFISGQNKLISFHQLFSNQDQFDLIKNNLGKIKLHQLQNAMSYFRLFQLAKELKYSTQELINFLKKALELDDENDAYRIYILQCLFLQKKYKELDNELKDILLTRYESFFKILYPYSLGSFSDCYEDYMSFEDKNYPYILFVASKICAFFGDMKKAQYLKLHIDTGKIENKLLKYLDLELFSAVAYVKSDIRYRLGNALIKGRISKMFKILIEEKKYIQFFKDPFEEPNLQKYSDYNDALRYKSHLSYQLGELLLQTHKNRYKGHYFILPFKIYRVYRKNKKG